MDLVALESDIVEISSDAMEPIRKYLKGTMCFLNVNICFYYKLQDHGELGESCMEEDDVVQSIGCDLAKMSKESFKDLTHNGLMFICCNAQDI